MLKNYTSWLLLLCLFTCPCMAQEHEIAITIDDLPFVGANNNEGGNFKRVQTRFTKIMHSLIENDVPATGFVIPSSIVNGEWQFLEEFRAAGFGIGNHTYSHANLNRLSTKQYINEISRADKILSPIMTDPKYFRYPYLAEGKGAVRRLIHDYLAANHYVVAPVTIDSKDYLFNERLLKIPWRKRDQHLSEIKRQYLDYIWKQTLIADRNTKDKQGKQILLIHANLLNSHFLGDIIQMYKKNGYHFISLSDALSNTAPHLSDDSNDDSSWVSYMEKTW